MEGQVTGAVDFGILSEDGLEGLIYISEIGWSLVKILRYYKVGEVVKAKIIEVKDNKISPFKAQKESVGRCR